MNYYLRKESFKGMTKITKEEVKKVAYLSRLELNENEINFRQSFRTSTQRCSALSTFCITRGAIIEGFF